MEKPKGKLSKWLKTLSDAINKKLNTAFPDPVMKYIFFGIMGFLELVLFYFLAVIDVGIWTSDRTISGMMATYILTKDETYPFALFLVLSVALWVAVFCFIIKQKNGNTGRGFDISDSNVYGSAREINLEELEQVTEIVTKKEAMGNILGQLDQTETRLITQKPIANFNNNLLCLAPPGSGKTATIVLPTIIQAIRRGESIVTTDTKGEVWSKTVELARRHGYKVRRFDLKDPTMSDGWDILGELRQSNLRAQIAATAIMKNTSLAQGGDPFVSAEQALLTALMLAMDLDKDVSPKHKSLTKATLDILPAGATALDSKFAAIKDVPEMNVAYRFYSTYITGSPNARSNVILNLSNRLNFLASPAIQEMTSTSDIDMTLPGQEKCIYYVVLPDQHDTMKVLSSLFFSFLFMDLCDYADSLPGQRLKVPVNIMIEEAYACGELPTITNALATVRSRGISISLIAQGIKQFHMLYGEDMTSSILECCATYACLGTNTEETAELFEWLSGHATVKVKTEQHRIGEGMFGAAASYSTGEGRQHLYSGNDIRKLKFGEIFLVWQRFDPLKAYSFFYKKHPEFEKGHMPEISGNTSVPLTNKSARAFIRELEDKRVEEYREWVANGGNPWEGYDRPDPPQKGEASGTDFPPLIPYPLLEELAIAQSPAKEPKGKMLKQVQNTPKEAPDVAAEEEPKPQASAESAPAAAAQEVGHQTQPESQNVETTATDKKGDPADKPESKAEASDEINKEASDQQPAAFENTSVKEIKDEKTSSPKPIEKKSDGQKKENNAKKKGGKGQVVVSALVESKEDDIPVQTFFDLGFGFPGEETIEPIKTQNKNANAASSNSLLFGATKIDT